MMSHESDAPDDKFLLQAHLIVGVDIALFADDTYPTEQPVDVLKAGPTPEEATRQLRAAGYEFVEDWVPLDPDDDDGWYSAKVRDILAPLAEQYSDEIDAVARHCPQGAELANLTGGAYAIYGVLASGLVIAVSDDRLRGARADGPKDAFSIDLFEQDEYITTFGDGTLSEQLTAVAALTVNDAVALRHRQPPSNR